MKATILIILTLIGFILLSVARCKNMTTFDIPVKEDIVKITISSVKLDDPYLGLHGNVTLLKKITNAQQIENILNFIANNNSWYVPWNLKVQPSIAVEFVNVKGDRVLILWFSGDDAIGMEAPITPKKPASVWVLSKDSISYIKELLDI